MNVYLKTGKMEGLILNCEEDYIYRYMLDKKTSNQKNIEKYVHICIGLIGLVLILLLSIFLDIYVIFILLPSFPFFILYLIKIISKNINKKEIDIKKSKGFILGY